MAMPGSISSPNSGSLKKIRKIQVVKWGTPKKIFLKKDAHHVAHVPVQVVVVNARRTLEFLCFIASDPEAHLRRLEGGLKDLETTKTSVEWSQTCLGKKKSKVREHFWIINNIQSNSVDIIRYLK